jgi:hypothetical protein
MKKVMKTEQSADRPTISLPGKKQSQLSDVEWRTRQLVALAEVFKEPLTSECLAMYVESLADLSGDQIKLCIGRAVRELEWFPKPAKLREFVGAEGSTSNQDAEARKAWDLVTSFASKWVQTDPEGNYVITRGVRSSEPPTLSDRILDTVRRTGGWKVYMRMTQEDFPFVQKRFFEEYKAWTAVERIATEKLLTETPRLQLVAKSMDAPRIVAPKQEPTAVPTLKTKPISAPMTDAQLRDRREILRQQAESLLKRKA